MMSENVVNLPADIAQTVRIALAEDVGDGDITAMLVAADNQMSATIIAKEAAILCGTAWADEVLRQIAPEVSCQWQLSDGDSVPAGSVIANLQGNARQLLTAERSMLNFLQTLSGTATHANSFAKLVGNSTVRILDTRKTLPCLRMAQKYAVRTGGCHNHRTGLFDAFLIKENHIHACGSIAAAIRKAREIAADKPLEIEVESLTEFKQALSHGADIIMLDEFSIADIAEAVKLNKSHKHPCKIEVSGNVNAKTLPSLAATGVDYISIGALTKHVKAIDLSMRFNA
ncbi:MAG: carboxylating nicotinate-nucleotide diphosphorylase [Pseudohongiella nitratireducens]|nr:carboxylating nicotinate-nucleotide diphosphorylase [Pseudohongiella nitratireducens]MDF1623036.1 carboxylating nicotinate-nucleotide diphosphorylase [Pseudohongiella nitratireducens]